MKKRGAPFILKLWKEGLPVQTLNYCGFAEIFMSLGGFSIKKPDSARLFQHQPAG
jgi:hypothetical protein